MFHYHLVLVEPLIPPNTGNAGRLCVATQSTLHLIEPLGFSIDDQSVRRAGLDYWKWVELKVHSSFLSWLKWVKENEPQIPIFLIENSKGFEEKNFYNLKLPSRAAFVFGKETIGLSMDILNQFPDQIYTIPMFSEKIRSLNLANTIAITLYEAIRQNMKSR